MQLPIEIAYRESLADMRAQIERTWDITKFFVLLNLTIIGGGMALLQLAVAPLARWLSAVAFLGGVGFAVVGIFALREAKRYYRVCVAKKTLYEEQLGMVRPFPGGAPSDVGVYALGALATVDKIEGILSDVDGYVNRRLRWGSLAGRGTVSLVAIGIFDALAALVAAWVAAIS